MRALAATHPAVAWAVLFGVVAAIVFVVVWFQPQKLFIDERADEALPGTEATATPEGTDDPDSEPDSEPKTVAEGEFQDLEHHTAGTAKIVELADGRRFLRFEGLETSNGPDLRVYLSEIPASNDWYAYGERYVDLGALKANLGDQNYEIPTDVDLSEYRSAVIWCRRFTVGFGVASLETT